MSRGAWAICRALLGLACLLALPAAAPLTASLDIEITSLRSGKGMLRLCLTAEPERFPDCKNGGIARTVSASSLHIRFEGLAPGTYALAVIHDENSNAKLDTFAGIPREGFGFSRNPAIGFGPPRFKSAGFVVGVEGAAEQVRIRYLL